MRNALLCFALFVTVFDGLLKGISAAKEGQPCRFQKATGICVGYSTCRPILEALGSRINICDYNAKEAVVCCPQDYQTRLQRIQAQNAGMSVSLRKCKEYERSATPTLLLGTLKPEADVIQKRGKACSTDNKLIVGGEKAKLGEFPHMAAIGYRGSEGSDAIEFKCGGTLISERFVLTAAHCSSGNPILVRLGDLDLKNDTDGAIPQDYPIDEFIRHPSYSGKTKHNDIAVVRLTRTVSFSPRIRPACLYQSADVKEQKLVASGYGAIESYGESANVLLKVVLDQFDQATCKATFSGLDRRLSSNIIDSQICAGYEAGGRDTCQGDSGGPLQLRAKENDCLFYVAAVTSYGRFCGGTLPAVYTRVGSYLPWIEKIVWSN